MIFSFLPRRVLNRLFEPGRSYPWNILLSNLLILLLGFAYARLVFAADQSPHRHAFCVSMALIGLPCPGCGVTTGLMHLFLWDIPAALLSNPAALLLLLAIILQVLGQALVLLGRVSMDCMQRFYRRMQLVPLSALLIIWGWRAFAHIT